MPTKHRRISVTVDPPLAEALERARRLRGEGPGHLGAVSADASLVHDLAIEGVERLELADADRRRLLAELADPELTASRLDPDAINEVLALRDHDPLRHPDA